MPSEWCGIELTSYITCPSSLIFITDLLVLDFTYWCLYQI